MSGVQDCKIECNIAATHRVYAIGASSEPLIYELTTTTASTEQSLKIVNK